MAKIRKTEHNGPKRGKGAYGRKADAKHESDRQRRVNDRTAVGEYSWEVIRGIHDHNPDERDYS